MDQPPAKRYKVREDRDRGFDAVVSKARNLKAAKEDPIMYDNGCAPMDSANRDIVLRIMTKSLKEMFMYSHPIYYLVVARINETVLFDFLVSSFEELERVEALLDRAEGLQRYTVQAYLEDGDRGMLFDMIDVDLICHLDDVDYFADEMITKHGVVFGFTGDTKKYLIETTKKPTNKITNLDMQYLRQSAERMNDTK